MAHRRTRRRRHRDERDQHQQQRGDCAAYRDPNHAAESPDEDGGDELVSLLELLLGDSLPELFAGRESVT